MSFDASSVTLRFLIVIVMILGLLIPLLFVQSLIFDRQQFQRQAEDDIARSWAGSQRIYGPILAIPYEVPATEDGSEAFNRRMENVFIAPATLNIRLRAVHEIRSRGIFGVPVFTVDISATGRFPAHKLEELEADYGTLNTNDTTLFIGVSDSVGIRSGSLIWNEQSIKLVPGPGFDNAAPGIHSEVVLNGQDTSAAFQFLMTLRATKRIGVVPVATESNVVMSSTWPHPSFQGDTLPDTREVSEEGFIATWSTQGFDIRFPSIFKTHTQAMDPRLQETNRARGDVGDWVAERSGAVLHDSTGPSDSALGFKAFQPDTPHRAVRRSTQYGIMFIVLTLAGILCVELVSTSRFHYVQYGVVGVGLVLFFLTLLSLSEHIGFGWGYLVASVLITAMITGYVAAAMGLARVTGTVACILILLYASLYTILHLDRYSLLVGTGLLIVLLAGLMVATYRLNRTG